MIRSNTGKKSQYQTYPDGWGRVCSVSDRRITGIKQEVVHFADTVVGERRFWDAQVMGVNISRAILVPYDTNVTVDDIFTIDGVQYEVKQKQQHDRTLPVSWLLSLSKAVILYKEAD